jgi:hypothetical protein
MLRNYRDIIMIYKNTRGLLVSLTLIGLLTSCAKKEQFIFTSDEDGVICSAKSAFNDTIFYENRFPDSTIFYYAVLSKEENKELKKSIQNLSKEKRLPNFELKPGSGTFTVASDDVHFYEANFYIHSPNIKKILELFRDKGPDMQPCGKVADFWNIDGVTPPENPEP